MTHEAGAVDCQAALRQVFQYLDAEMSAAERERMARHLAECDDCDHEVGLEAHLKELVRRSCCDTAPAELRVRIAHQIAIQRTV